MWTFTTGQLFTLITLAMMGGTLIGVLVSGLMQTAAKDEPPAPMPIYNFPHTDFPDRRARMERITRPNGPRMS